MIQKVKNYVVMPNQYGEFDIRPDKPYVAMNMLNLTVPPIELALDDAVIFRDDMRAISYLSYSRDGSYVEREPNEEAGFAYILYSVDVDTYNERKRRENPDWVDVLGFSSVQFLLKDCSHSIINDNFKFINRPLDGTKTVIDFSDLDRNLGALSLDVPIGTWLEMKGSSVGISSDSISVDTTTTPNILDQDINYKMYNPPSSNRSRNANENDDDDGYYIQEYIREDGINYRLNGLAGYNIDLDVYCLRELTVTPQSFPYTFRISDYNSGYNTNYVGIRNLTIDYTPPSSLPVIVDNVRYNYGGYITYNTWNFTTLTENTQFTIANQNLLIVFDYNDYYRISLYCTYGTSKQININYSSSYVVRYCQFNASYPDAKIQFYNGNSLIFEYKDYGYSDSTPSSIDYRKSYLEFNWLAP